MELIHYLIIGAVVLGSSCVQGSVGFGLGMITAPVLVLLEPNLLPAALLLLATLTSFTAFIRERADVDGSPCWARLADCLESSSARLQWCCCRIKDCPCS